MKRPSVMTSSVATCSATSTGLSSGSRMTVAPTRMVPASAASRASAGRLCTSWNGVERKCWPITMRPKPASRAARTWSMCSRKRSTMDTPGGCCLETIRPKFMGSSLLDQAVEPPGVQARDLAHRGRRQVSELLLDVLGRLRPHPVAVGVVGPPHQGVLADLVDQLGADPVELEGGLALPPPVVAGLHGEAEVAEAVLPLEVHAVESVRQPADAALAERDADARIAPEHRA